jgi:uncharacterized coiled-coil protein SlyX|tara:strand:- start:2293 stop:2523 length:231 start_codon:yes stop_codon:yes gene_type:complete
MRGNFKKKPSNLRKEISMLDFRVLQLEIALSNLMHVVANQDEELDSFKEKLEYANNLMEEDESIFEILSQSEGAEA